MVDSSSTSELHHLFTYGQPLGPDAVEPTVHPKALSQIYLNAVSPYHLEIPPDQATYIMGRRGSGKTTLLLSAAGFAPDKTVNLYRSDILTGMRDLITVFEKGIAFTLSLENRVELWRNVFAIAGASQLAYEANPTTHTSERIQLREFLAGLKKEGELSQAEPNDLARAFEDLIMRRAKESIRGPLSNWLAGITLENITVGTVVANVNVILREEKRHLTILVDSLEELTGRPARFEEVLKPLFALLGRQARLGTSGPGLYVRCCLPTELADRLHELSENSAKDFVGTCYIQWQTRDLAHLITNRLRLFADVLSSRGHVELSARLDAAPSEPRACLSSFLPMEVTNPCNMSEDPLPYILRHTQLLPRQLIRLFNHMLCGRERIYRLASGQRLKPEEVVGGVRRAEDDLCLEVINAHRHNFKNSAAVLNLLVPNLPHRFTHADLLAKYKELSLRRHTRDFSDLLTMLFKLGVVGRVHDETERYVGGEFSYIFPAGLVASESQDLCLHPMFSRYKGRRVGLHKPIYPAPALGADDLLLSGLP